jgi:single-strand DNA-binding protein
MNFNKAIIIGRLTRDPEAKVIPESGNAISNFGVATNRVWTDAEGQKQEQVEFHNVVAFGRLAEICNQYLTKGCLVCVEGRLQTRSWISQQDGVKRFRTEIIANNMQMGPRLQGAGYTAFAPQPSVGISQEGASDQMIQTEPPAEPVIDLAPEETKEQPSGEFKGEEEVDLKNVPF